MVTILGVVKHNIYLSYPPSEVILAALAVKSTNLTLEQKSEKKSKFLLKI